MNENGAKPDAQPASATGEPYRVLVVDDSAIIRGLLSRTLDMDPEITVVDSAANGQIAVASATRHKPDVIVLDIEMPVMDGITALPKLIAADPTVKIIMASTLTMRNASISMRALALGAADYIPKPSSAGEITGGFDFKRELIDKVKALGAARRAGAAPARKIAGGPAPAAVPSAPSIYRNAVVTLRTHIPAPPAVVAIGSSTGGPQALFEVLPALTAELRQPILITQHMPATFTTILAEHIQKLTNRPCAEAVDGEPLIGGKVYIAPGNYHMTVGSAQGKKVVRLAQTPPENFCRPAVDPMLRSLAELFGRNVLVIMLTGMGQDGKRGSEAVVNAGGTVIAQDEQSSVVWGMPGAVATAGLCTAVLPLNQIAAYARRIAAKQAA